MTLRERITFWRTKVDYPYLTNDVDLALFKYGFIYRSRKGGFGLRLTVLPFRKSSMTLRECINFWITDIGYSMLYCDQEFVLLQYGIIVETKEHYKLVQEPLPFRKIINAS